MLLSGKAHASQGTDLLAIELHAIKRDGGWGYDILVDKKLFIHQDCIPAIPSPKCFVSETEALLTGNSVVEKIKKGKLPAVTIEELKALHIHY